MAAGVVMTKGPLVTIMWIGVVLSLLFVSLRTYIQYQKAHRLFANDYFIFFALTMHVVAAILYQFAIPPMYELVYVGKGVEAPTAGFVGRAELFLKLQFAVDFVLWTTLWAVKFSLLLFFWRLFDSVQSRVRVFWWAMCGVTASTWIVACILQTHACDPIRDFFVLGKCASKRDLYFSNLVFRFVVGTDIAGDILSEFTDKSIEQALLGIVLTYLRLVMAIPFPLLTKLQVSLRQKYILGAIFLLPIVPTIFAILRLVIANATSGNVDPIAFQLYSMLENSLAIITSCLPSIRLFIVNKRTNTSYTPNPDGSSNLASVTTKPHASRRRTQKGSIPLDTLVSSQNGNVYEDTTGILVKQDYRVDTSVEELHPRGGRNV